MSKLISMILLLLCITITTYTPAVSCSGEKWTKTNTNIQLVDTIVLWIDYKQTRRFLSPALKNKEYYELNPLLGRYPSPSKLLNTSLGYGILHFTLAYCLPPKKRQTYQALMLIGRLLAVMHNHQSGIKINF